MSSSWFDDFGDDPVTYWFVDYIEHLLTKINLYIYVCARARIFFLHLSWYFRSWCRITEFCDLIWILIMHYSVCKPKGTAAWFFSWKFVPHLLVYFDSSLADTCWMSSLYQLNITLVLLYREKELAAVKINAADVDIIASELEVTFLVSFHLH